MPIKGMANSNKLSSSEIKMNSARKIPAPVSNPIAVMRIIETSDQEKGLTTLLPREHHPVGIKLKLHIDADQEARDKEEFRFDQPPGQRSEQLVNYLRNLKKELVQREADLQAQTYQWEKQVLATEASLRKRSNELEQHLAQVTCQQAQLIKLQQNLVDSQEAIRSVVERLVSESQGVDTRRQLSALQNEIVQRFDENFQRWERLVHCMNVESDTILS